MEKISENDVQSQVPLEVEITNEGFPTVEVKQTAQFIRNNFVTQQNVHLSTSIRFADTKAGALLAVSGILLPQTVNLLSAAVLYQKILYFISLGILLAGLLFTFLVILPRNKNSDAKGIIYWDNIANFTQQEFVDHVKTTDTVNFVDAWLHNNYIQAVILKEKFHRLEIGFKLTLGAFLLMGGTFILPHILELF